MTARKRTSNRIRTTLILSFALLTTVAGGADNFRGRWKCVALDASHLALTGDYGEVQDRLFRKHFDARRKAEKKKLPGWAKDLRFYLAAEEAIAEYRPQVTAMLRDRPTVGIAAAKPVSAVQTGYWMSPLGLSLFPDENGKARFARCADTAHHLYLTLDRPLTEGEKITITLPGGEKIAYTRRHALPSPLFKINQLGYMPKALKYAYVGAWLGTAGPLPLHKELDGKEFHLCEADGGKTVFSGKLRARMPDPTNAAGSPFTGEEVLELEFTHFTTPGTYYLDIPGVARSDAFRIGDDTMAEAFFIHARGLFHQRCGIAKTEPYTHWHQEACHQTCVRGTFPPEIRHYGKGDAKRRFGFTDEAGNSLQINHFELIRQNVPLSPEVLSAPGGWHDAADWDRRPQHMGISGDLAAVYLLRPENFCDGQLNLPESGNGIPDILDEARWGLEHLRKKQQSDGGVGTWEETVRHPKPSDGMASADKLTYYLSCATRNSTLEYAAYASLLALAMRKAGAAEIAAQFLDSAKKAWRYALAPDPPKTRVYKMKGKTVFYREPPGPAPEFLVKAGYNLYQLTGEEAYLRRAEDAVKEAEKVMKKDGWRWSPFLWIELEIFPSESAEMEKLRSARRRVLVAAANLLLRQQEENYPVRIAWFGPREGWVHTMGWGTYHPLVRARTLIAAHATTGDQAYLDGAMIANDFHNGANPSGSTMTSGLGRVYPVRFLDLNSYADGIAEQIPGITPYRNTYGIPRRAIEMAFGLFYAKLPKQHFPGLALSLVPEPGLDKEASVQAVARTLPIWKRWCNVDSETVAASEFTVWETIGPAAAVTGYLLNGAARPDPRWIERRPADDIRKLPGYAPLP